MSLQTYLANPPITELVCALSFEPALSLTPVDHGRYWERSKARFQRAELDPAAEDKPTIRIGLPLLRTWLVTPDERRLVQLQHDRFIANWRRQDAHDQYPRFDTVSGDGFLQFVLAELGHYQVFAKEVGAELLPHTLELNKINSLIQGRHWTDATDLARLLPVVASIHSTAGDPAADFLLRTRRELSTATLHVTCASGTERSTGSSVVRLELRAVAARDERPLEEQLRSLNAELNTSFFTLLAASELGRFA